MANTITLGGSDLNVAPLKSLQVAAFFDEIEETKSAGETKVKMFTRNLRIIYLSLKNAGNPTVKDLDETQGIAAVNEMAAYEEVTPAFLAVLEVSGLRKTEAGEAPAAGSTGIESSAA